MNKPLKHLDLFSGIGGFALGLKRAGGFETVAFCEIDKYCQKILAKNFHYKPIFKDVKKLTHMSTVDIIQLCQILEKINTIMLPGYMTGDYLYRTLPIFTVLPDKPCTQYYAVEEIYFAITKGLEKITISIEEVEQLVIIPKMLLSMLYEKVLLIGKHTAKNAVQIQFLKMEEAEYKPTIVTITSLLKLCGYVKNVILNGIKITPPTNGRKEVLLSVSEGQTIDVISGGYP